MRTRYIYRTVAGNISFRFREGRESFDDSYTVQGVVFYWRDTAPIVFEQLMVEAELTRKYKV